MCVCVCEREREYRAAVEVDMAFLAWEDDFCLAISCQKFSKLTFLVSSLPPFGRNRGLQPLRRAHPLSCLPGTTILRFYKILVDRRLHRW
jgi:hypothetical protein